MDFSFIYRAVIFDINKKPRIDKTILQFELMRALTTMFVNQIISGSIKVMKITNFKWNFKIHVVWKNKKTSELIKSMEIVS